MVTQEDCKKALEDLSKALNVSFDKSETISKHILSISKDDGAKFAEIVKAVKTTYGAINKLKSNDPAEVICGVLDTVGAFAPLVGPQGMVLSGICGLISCFISASDSSGPNYQKLIDSALEQSRCSNLEEKAAGVGKTFAEWHIYMSHANSKLTEKDIDDLITNYGLQTGTGFLGELLKHIKDQKTKRKDAPSAKGLLHLIKLYCQLSITREMLLHQMYTLIVNSKKRPSTIKSYRGVIENLTSCKEDLKFLHRPSLKEIVMASVYIPEEWPEIAKYLKHIGVQDVGKPYPDEQELRVERWPNHHLVSRGAEAYPKSFLVVDFKYYLETCKISDIDGPKFLFNREENGLFKINMTKGNYSDGKGYLSMYLGCWGLNGDAQTSSFKLIITDNEKCLLSCSQFPTQFMYVTKFSGQLAMDEGDPGPAGYWQITTR